jgi:hypothetical protein
VARLAIVIPHWGNVRHLEDTLVSVLENRPDDSQIVVVLSDLYDDPYDLKDEVSFVYAPIGTDRVRCMNLGIDAVDAPLVHLLAPGVQVSPGWADAAMAHFVDPRVVAVAPLMLDRETPERVLAAGVEYRSGGAARAMHSGKSLAEIDPKPATVLGPVPRAAFYRKSALNRVDCFAPELGEWLAGVDLALMLQHTGGRCVLEPNSRVHAAVDETPAGAFRRALRAERLFWRWAPRAGWSRALVAHGGEMVVDFCANVPGPGMVTGLAGRLAGLCTIGEGRRHRRRLAGMRHEGNGRGTARPPHFAAQGTLAEE